MWYNRITASSFNNFVKVVKTIFFIFKIATIKIQIKDGGVLMFKINEHIMYGNVGVCQVVDITNEKFANNMQRECYVLDPIYSKNTVIKIPVDNERIAMRRILSKEEITSLINDINNREVLCIEDDKKRNEQHKMDSCRNRLYVPVRVLRVPSCLSDRHACFGRHV